MDGRYTVRITNPNATPWTRREEVCQRLTNCKNFLTFAWLALWTDSALFAAVIFNTVRTEGDGLIGRMTMKSGNDIQVISERDLPKPPPYQHMRSRGVESETVNLYVKQHSHTIASQVLFFRIHRGLTQKQLGELCGMKQSAIARLEKTPDVKWTAPTLMKIADALDVRVSADIIPNEDLQKPLRKR